MKKRVTVGLLSNMLTNTVRRHIWYGASDAARKHDANIICFLGGGSHHTMVSKDSGTCCMIW